MSRTWVPKIGTRVIASRALMLSSTRSAYRGMPHVQGFNEVTKAWLFGKPLLITEGSSGVIVGLPDTSRKYQLSASQCYLAVHWDAGPITCLCKYDLIRV